jgi:hypothetical protein
MIGFVGCVSGIELDSKPKVGDGIVKFRVRVLDVQIFI